MTVVLDTGPLVSYMDPDDRRYDRACSLMEPLLAGRHGMLLTTDTVYDEGMTLIRRRKRSRELLVAFHELFWGPWEGFPRPFQVLSTSLEDHRAAGELQVSHHDQGLSQTDATLVLHAREHDALVATFDGGFEGVVGRVPEDPRGS